MNETEELASDWLRSSVSSPGIPKTYLTPSASRHSTKRSDARRLAMLLPYPEWATAPRSATRCSVPLMRRIAPVLVLLSLLALAPAADAASRLVVKGRGWGHGIG